MAGTVGPQLQEQVHLGEQESDDSFGGPREWGSKLCSSLFPDFICTVAGCHVDTRVGDPRLLYWFAPQPYNKALHMECQGGD